METIYLDPQTNDEFMVHADNGKPEMIYCYRDNESRFISTANWQPKQNQVFIHCPRIELLAAFKTIQAKCILCDVPAIILEHY